MTKLEKLYSIIEMGLTGFHWRNLDEDISFESFEYDDVRNDAGCHQQHAVKS